MTQLGGTPPIGENVRYMLQSPEPVIVRQNDGSQAFLGATALRRIVTGQVIDVTEDGTGGGIVIVRPEREGDSTTYPAPWVILTNSATRMSFADKPMR